MHVRTEKSSLVEVASVLKKDFIPSYHILSHPIVSYPVPYLVPVT